MIAGADLPELGRYPLGGGRRPEAKGGLAGAFPLAGDSGVGKARGEEASGVIKTCV